MTAPRLHRPVIGDDGRPECSCGSAVTEWHPEHDWDTALVCYRSQTPIATRAAEAALYSEWWG
ncbi:MAG: hypothetical protein OXT70_01145 [Chloroflexota bacterium]|nr:hypothetical protein [Chloroflexota bacterium]